MAINIPNDVERLPSGVEVVTGKGGKKLFKKDGILNLLAQETRNGNHIKRGVKKMSEHIEEAQKDIEALMTSFDATASRLADTERKIAEQAKKVSGSLRDSSEKLSQGLTRVEKSANFDKLATYVELLERASVAMSTLADLEEKGLLERIAKSVK